MRYFNKLNGERLYLSPLNLEDYEIYTKWMNDLSTQVPIGNVSNIYGLEQEKEALNRLSKEEKNFAIVLKEKDELIGNCSLFDVSLLHGTAEVGIFIGEEHKRNKGYGSEAIRVILSYGFNILNLNNIMLKVFAFNERGIAAYRKIGFKEIGRRTEAMRINQKYFDEIYMEILARDFEEDFLLNALPK